jgi:hypothetical protein
VAEALQRELLDRQNRDGGWGFQGATSWTEPTALALLALETSGYTGSAYSRGCAWLHSCQHPNGGWPPAPSVQMESAVTALAFLALSTASGRSPAQQRALRWLLGQIKPELNLLQRLASRIQGMPESELLQGGTPWTPGVAAWIAPTSMAALAFSDALRQGYTWPEIPVALDRNRRYILSRRCADGGWNHGGSTFRSEKAESYPETTGMALLALDRCSAAARESLSLARTMLNHAMSSEAQSWLTMCLVHHRSVPAACPEPLPSRNTRDIALRLLSIACGSTSNRITGART